LGGSTKILWENVYITLTLARIKPKVIGVPNKIPGIIKIKDLQRN